MSTTKDEVTVNTKYKDRLFCYIFGHENNKKNILSLYNALNNTTHDNVNDVTITTIDDVIYIKMKNDVSFLLDSEMSLWEQQSSYNPNMPVRGLMYFGELYSSYIKKHGLNLYGSKLIKIPTPRYIVFYNGEKDVEPVKKLYLSDSFIKKDEDNEFEWTATMINLNEGKNQELLNKCKILHDYAYFVESVRKYQKAGLDFMNAVDQTIDDCIQKNVLAEFLTRHRAEVLNMCLTEYNEQVFINGIAEEEASKIARKMFEKGYSLSEVEDIIDGLSVDELQQIEDDVKV